MTNQATVRSTGTSISTNTSTSMLENASIVQTLFDLFRSAFTLEFNVVLDINLEIGEAFKRTL